MATLNPYSYLEQHILPIFKTGTKAGLDINLDSVTWKDQGKVGPNAYAFHLEDQDKREYILLLEDFPGGDYLSDGLTHEIVAVDNKSSFYIGTPEKDTGLKTPGYFTLYREKTIR